MKNIFLSLLVVGLMISCGGKNQPVDSETTKIQSTEVIEQFISDGHNAKNSLDYKGTYKGLIPTASGEGMEIVIILGDSTFSKSVLYVGKEKEPTKTKGKYIWNAEGTIITLQGIDKPNQYFVSESVLIHLDTEGNRIESEMADLYNLSKIE